jgi:hypothetical protein
MHDIKSVAGPDSALSAVSPLATFASLLLLLQLRLSVDIASLEL